MGREQSVHTAMRSPCSTPCPEHASSYLIRRRITRTLSQHFPNWVGDATRVWKYVACVFLHEQINGFSSQFLHPVILTHLLLTIEWTIYTRYFNFSKLHLFVFRYYCVISLGYFSKLVNSSLLFVSLNSMIN